MIVSRLIGGLGNQMFQYALAKKLAIKNNTEVYFDLHLLLDHNSKKKIRLIEILIWTYLIFQKDLSLKKNLINTMD
jgi:hypothetical protein